MLAEIFLVNLEMQLRVAATATSAVTTSSDRRFVPVTLPRETPRKPN
jgi:hypothetical protein